MSPAPPIFEHPIYNNTVIDGDSTPYDELAGESKTGREVTGDEKRKVESEGMLLKSPSMLLAIYDDNIRNRKRSIYKWQYDVHMQFAFGKRETLAENDEYKTVNRMSVVANNGSGKSSYTIAPCAVWFAMRYKRSRAVVTSASGTQLDRQVGRTITNLCRKVNEKHGCILWKCNYRYLTFIPTGSTIELYATDDPQKAEGYHPHDDGEMFAIFVDEAKSVEEKIYEALSRCNGITHRMDISSPGGPKGHFYSLFSSHRWWTRKVTYHDCAHISLDEVEEAKERYGEQSAWFKSAYLAEFCSVDETIVLTWEQIQKCLKNLPEAMIEGRVFMGVDLSIGGDENVITLARGNAVIKQIAFNYTDSTLTVNRIKNTIDQYKIDCIDVNIDDGGVGKPMLDMLWRDGYMVNRVRNESEARDKKTFSNRGTEMWYNIKRLIEECDIIFPNDPVLVKQLSSRFYKQGDALGKILLESKRIARAHGHGSPDRADSLVLCFANKRFPLYNNIAKSKTPERVAGANAIYEELRKRRYAFSGVDAALSGQSTNKPRIHNNLGNLNN